MEHNLTTEQLARVFGERIGQQIIIDNEITTIEGVCGNEIMCFDQNTEDISQCKLLLTPLEKISDDHILELVEFSQRDRHYTRGEPFIIRTKGEITLTYSDNFGFRHRNLTLRTHLNYNDHAVFLDEFNNKFDQHSVILNMLFDWGYDYKKYFFGIDHPDNGKTLIELGIAIDKTTI